MPLFSPIVQSQCIYNCYYKLLSLCLARYESKEGVLSRNIILP